jgi:hypothetical protein
MISSRLVRAFLTYPEPPAAHDRRFRHTAKSFNHTLGTTVLRIAIPFFSSAFSKGISLTRRLHHPRFTFCLAKLLRFLLCCGLIIWSTSITFLLRPYCRHRSAGVCQAASATLLFRIAHDGVSVSRVTWVDTLESGSSLMLWHLRFAFHVV